MTPISVFPYPPLMLYLYKLILMLTKTLGLEEGRWLAFFYLLPTFFADIGIAHVFRSIFPRKSKTVLFFYCCSPIVVYSMYICGHLDLLALFFMLLAFFCLRQWRFSISAIITPHRRWCRRCREISRLRPSRWQSWWQIK